jgi:hypothetical protein
MSSATNIEFQHESRRYFWLSDRFYIDEVKVGKDTKSPLAVACGDQSDEENEKSTNHFFGDQLVASGTTLAPSRCCAIHPFFSRGALVGSLVARNELEACVLMTYSCRLSSLKEEFPTMLATEVVKDPIIILLFACANSLLVVPGLAQPPDPSASLAWRFRLVSAFESHRSVGSHICDERTPST